MTQPFVSLVITTKNEEKNIGNCLESIRWQTYPQNLLEVIIVDNNSLDKTKEIAGKYTKNVFNKGPERSAQRNYGMKMARGKYLMYLDADMILSPTVIARAVEKLSQVSSTPPVALYIPEIVLGNSYWGKVRRFERSFYDGTVIDCARFIRKDTFEQVGGFDLNMTGPEDWDFDFHLPFDSTGQPYTPIWNMWLRNNLETILSDSENSRLNNVDIWIGTSPQQALSYREQTLAWINHLESQGFDPEVYEYSGYEGHPATSDQYIYDLMEQMLIFHSRNFEAAVIPGKAVPTADAGNENK